ncbi:D-type cyclin [Zea mays]|uniref:Cyclin-D5-1 n=1 Tax=Zea mays TaxID=4577 RepID=B4FQ15_MAIZE|nr:D-type cyclin [Zea mays]ACF84208.1 unknown [Zea mays]ACF88408.1 unknown [Zea mays]AQL08965.1 Cyclin-D5-1 [Zea mays]|eukprot:NP_001105049.2 D-type cyclin [Zea mays]
MGDAAAAAASTSAPTTPTSILICLEDGSDLLADADDGAGTDLVVARDERLLVVDQDEEYVALLLSKESASGGGGGPVEEMEDWMKAARSGCVRWIIKTTAMFRFGGKTAYVAVNYLDRFLAQRRVNREHAWGLQLLMVACMSLATKLEEQHAPRLSELPLDACEFAFDRASVLRMELLVLGTLEWRMVAVTPFPYISCFAARFGQDERRAVLVRAVECVFAAIRAMSSVEYQPSTIAVASILVARGRETPADNLDALKAILGSSFPQLDTGHVYSCYSAMIREDDKSPTQSTSTSTGVASSGVSVAAHAGGSGSPSPPGASVSVGANNAAGTAPPATTDNRNKRRRLRSPQRQ